MRLTVMYCDSPTLNKDISIYDVKIACAVYNPLCLTRLNIKMFTILHVFMIKKTITENKGFQAIK